MSTMAMGEPRDMPVAMNSIKEANDLRHHCCLPGAVLAGNRNGVPGLGIESRYCNVGF